MTMTPTNTTTVNALKRGRTFMTVPSKLGEVTQGSMHGAGVYWEQPAAIRSKLNMANNGQRRGRNCPFLLSTFINGQNGLRHRGRLKSRLDSPDQYKLK